MLDGELSTRGRYEKKFQTHGESDGLRGRFVAVATAAGFVPDPYGNNATYELCSLYFDTPDFRCVRANADGDYLHFKFRIRMYAGGDKLFYEVKYKLGDLIFKRRRALPLHQISEELARREFRDLILGSGSRTLISTDVLAAVSNLRPAALVRYRRTALVGAPFERLCLDGNLAFGPPVVDTRVWFGNTLACTDDRLHVLEIKTHPQAVSRALLAVGNLAQHDIGRFSKYCEAATWAFGDPEEYGMNPYLRLGHSPLEFPMLLGQKSAAKVVKKL